MPEMQADEFKLIDWRTMDPTVFSNYVDGKADSQQRTLTAAQIVTATKAYEWSTGDLGKIADIGADSIFGNLPITRWGRMFWFMYFWKEAKSGLNRADAAEIGYGIGNDPKANVAYIFSQLFIRPAPGPLPDSLVPRKSFDTIETTKFQTYLYVLLEIGFKKIPIGVPDGQITQAAFEWKKYCLQRDKKSLEIAWRAEDRTAIEIVEKGGFEPQVHDQAWATLTNMNADWHPFSKDSVKNYLWYRLGQNDNCKYTVTSLAKEIRVALSFPKFDTDNFPLLPKTDPDTMSPQERSLVRKGADFLIGEVTLEGGGRTEIRFLLVTKVTVAQVILENYIFDSQQAQEAIAHGFSFKEIGVGKVPMRNIVGLFSFFRVHHGLTEAEGFTALINRAGCTPINAQHLLRFTASENEANELAGILQPLYSQTLSFPPTASTWGSNGYAEPSKKLSLKDGTAATRVLQIKLNGSSVYTT